MELDVGQAVLLGPGEGERLNERIVVKIERPEISVNEVDVGPEFEGPGPHFHKEHVDAFYVLEGELEFINGTETLRAGAGTTVAVAPGIVHGFTNPGPGRARYLNIHAPDGDFIEYLRRAIAGEDFAWDSFDVDEPYGPAEAIVAGPNGGERLKRRLIENTIRAETTELSLFELTFFDDRWEGVDPHSHDDHVDSFFVLDGEVEFLLGDRTARVGAGTYFAAPPNVTHGFRPVGPARLFNLHAPDAGFAGRARGR
ncbi:MAG TPA: cupin domain-containing protein [Gaiellaceae bacterium]|jgi:quercetin dioxygenase-like cupin family protein|nr:cupin domain-containing protein [Gaiellaceae bacterium]